MKTCVNCQYFEPYRRRTSYNTGDGLCRHDTPQIDPEGNGLWPSVTEGDWCGQHEGYVVREPADDTRL